MSVLGCVVGSDCCVDVGGGVDDGDGFVVEVEVWSYWNFLRLF